MPRKPLITASLAEQVPFVVSTVTWRRPRAGSGVRGATGLGAEKP